MLTPFFAVVVDVSSQLERDSVLTEFPYAVKLVLISDIMERLKKKFINWNKACVNKGWKGNL